MSSYPTISDLANASEEEVLRLWQGLGYYSRARNLHATAKFVHHELGGEFPSTYDRILSLKGVGPYTAAAISSICFGEPRPVVDGNVYRFASRYFGIEEDISRSGTRKTFEAFLEKHIDPKQPGEFNQAMMEFGATVCSPTPKCDDCPFSSSCYAFRLSRQSMLPVKTKKTKVRERQFHYIVFKNKQHYFLRQRSSKDVWQGLYDFYQLEGQLDEEAVLAHVKELFGTEGFVYVSKTHEMVHLLSHQKIKAVFYDVEIDYNSTTLLTQKHSLRAYSILEMLNLPKAKLIVNYLDQAGIK